MKIIYRVIGACVLSLSGYLVYSMQENKSYQIPKNTLVSSWSNVSVPSEIYSQDIIDNVKNAYAYYDSDWKNNEWWIIKTSLLDADKSVKLHPKNPKVYSDITAMGLAPRKKRRSLIKKMI